MIFLVDMDGVLADLDAGFEMAWRLAHPDRPTIPFHKRAKFRVDEEHSEDDRERVYEVLRSSGLFASLAPLPGAIEGFRHLAQRGEVWICTAPMEGSRTCIEEKLQWVKNHLGAEWCNRVIVTRDKTIVRGDVLIDDNPKITGAMTPTWEHWVLAAPYNAGAPGVRLHWHEIANADPIPHYNLRRAILLCVSPRIGLRFLYVNHEGVRSVRTVSIPQALQPGDGLWHSEESLVMRAFCRDRWMIRDFCAENISDCEIVVFPDDRQQDDGYIRAFEHEARHVGQAIENAQALEAAASELLLAREELPLERGPLWDAVDRFGRTARSLGVQRLIPGLAHGQNFGACGHVVGEGAQYCNLGCFLAKEPEAQSEP